jgi:hypothetical protein
LLQRKGYKSGIMNLKYMAKTTQRDGIEIKVCPRSFLATWEYGSSSEIQFSRWIKVHEMRWDEI